MTKKILIIEDSPTSLELMAGVFGIEGYDIARASNGEEGVKAAAAEKPDLVIVDTVLPGIDGFEVCRRIKKLPDAKDIKVIITTGSLDAVDGVKARKAGADDYCVKTQDMYALVSTVKKMI